MIVKKITNGFVIQTFDTDKKEFISQEFIAGDECEYEDEIGNSVDADLLNVDMQELYLPYEMVQPEISLTPEEFEQAIDDWIEGEAGE